MAIKIGPDFKWRNPFGLLSTPDKQAAGPANAAADASAPPATAPARRPANISDADWNDLVNTVIAEAGGEGPEGMAAVAHTIRNRADRRGQDLGAVVRAPKQFEGYEAPGAGSRKAQRDPQVRATAEQILTDVLGGALPDPTGGADHFHATYVSPGWASAMPQTAKIGGHIFYDSGQKPRRPAAATPEDGPLPGSRPATGGGGDPEGRGFARLAPRETVPPQSDGAGGALRFRHKGQDTIQDTFRAVLEDASRAMGVDFDITSGYRSPSHSVEARKRRPGEHSRGHAADISMRGMNTAERSRLVRELQARGVKRFGIYKNSPDMLHVDMKDQTGTGKPWFMYDRTNRNMRNAPQWFRDLERGEAPQRIAVGETETRRGKVDPILIDAAFEANDPMGVYAGQENPFGATMAKAVPPTGMPDEPQTEAPDLATEQYRALEQEEPGRYELVDVDAVENWRAAWEAEQPGLAEDLGRLFGGSVVEGVGHIVRGIGAFGASVARPTIEDIINPIFGTDFQPSNPLGGAADAVTAAGGAIKDGISAATREAVDASSPDGDILAPSTWTLGEAPSLRGYTALALDVLGSMTPVLAAAVLSGPTAGMMVGGAQGGGAAEQQAHELIDTLAERGELERESAYYREQLAAGRSPDEALAATRQAAGEVAFLFTAPVSGLGGAATSKIVDPATQVLAGKNIVARIAGRAGLSGLEEGAQEAAETVATRAGVNVGAGTDLDVREGTFGDFVLGALGGGVPGAVAGAASRREEQPSAPPDMSAPGEAQDAPLEATPAAEPERRKGPLRRAADYGAERAPALQAPEFIVQEPAIGDMPAGEMDGERVRLSPDQSGMADGMRRVVTSAGEERIIGERILAPAAPAMEPPREADGEAAGAEPAVEGRDDAPPPGSTVRVDAEGVEPFMGRVEAHDAESGEVVVFDGATGEVYQVPPGAITVLHRMGDPIAGAPTAPAPAETRNELPPQAQDKPALERFPGPPEPGRRIIVSADGVERFAGRIVSYEDGATEALVARDDGVELQVPVDHLYVSGQTRAQVEAEDAKRNPPVERERATGPTVRDVFDRQVELPDDRHARLFDLGRLRRDSRKTLGASQLDMDAVSPAEQARLAEAFGISMEALGQMADDYRYRVERAAKEARSKLAVKMHAVNERRLKQWQAERRKTMPPAEITNPDSLWWDGTLTAAGRKEVLQRAGVKRSEKTLWRHLPKNIQQKLVAARGDETADGGALDEAAHEAATSPSNALPEPTQAQKEAGNYRLGHIRVGGMDISVENPAGSMRRGTDRGGKKWSVEMKDHYGYIRGTRGRDKDHIDIFVKPGADATPDAAFGGVFVVDQVDPATGRFDEHKVMAGFATIEEAEAAYRANYAKGWKGLGGITEAALDDFKRWLADGDTTKPFARAREAVAQRDGGDPEARKSDTKPRKADSEQEKADSAPARRVRQRWDEIPMEENTHPAAVAFNRLRAFANDLTDEQYWTLAREFAPGKSSQYTFPQMVGNAASERTVDVLINVWASALKGNETREPGQKLPETANTKEAVQKKLDEWGAQNRLVSRDRASEIRRRLKDKLKNQLSAGLDPEILALGAELAAFHIEAGARRFGAFAAAVAQDMETSVGRLRPYLRAWYNGARDMMEDSGLSIDGMDDADAVRAELARMDRERERPDESPELGRSGPPALEGAPAAALRGAEEGRKPRRQPAGSGEPDLFGGEPSRGGGGAPRGGVADGARDVSAAAARSQRGRAERAGIEPDAGDRAGQASRGDGAGGSGLPDSRPDVDASQSAAIPAADRPADFTITDADAIGQGGAKAKYRANVAAIRLLRTLEDARRPATRAEQAVLAKWVGWGGLRAAFPREDGSTAKGWEREAAELKELLSPEEYRAAESSTRNAHYTSPEVVDAIWSIARRLGFTGGRVLEPSVGAGNFLGLMPAQLRADAQVTGVELDRVTGGIAKHLYPAANIQAPLGFQDLTVPDGYFDLAIGNPPFGSEKLYDAERRHLNRYSIHNYFFAKSIDALRPGGVLAMVVTNYFLDAKEDAARRYIAGRADLVGAIRLPNNAFLANAGTEVTTDIVVFRKRLPSEEDLMSGSLPWVDAGTFRDRDGNEVALNGYFRANPDMMLGEFGAFGTMYRGGEAALVARDGDNLPALLAAAIEKLPEGIMSPADAVAPETVAVPDNVGDAPVGSVFLSPDGTVHRRTPDLLGEPQAESVSFPSDKAKDRVAGMIRVRDAFARLRRAQIDESATDAKLANLRKLLNERYDAFVKANGPINADANRRLFRDDPTWPQISALEQDFDKGVSTAVAKTTGEKARPPSARKAPIFEKRTQQPYRAPTSANSAKDALALTLADLGRVDLDAMARLYRKPAATIVEELGALLYQTPAGAWETADQYLSGNVKAKLAEARRAAETDPAFRRNVAALQDVIPADIEPVDIDVKPGAPWLPANHVADFVDHITEGGGAKAVYSRVNAKWMIDAPRSSAAGEAQWATNRVTVAAVLDAVLNAQSLTVRDRMSDGTYVVNAAATDAANEKAARVRAEWQRWIWQDDGRRDHLARLYNDTFNTDVQRAYDGSHLTLPGKVGDDVIALRPHQLSFVWRTLQSGTALADHTVGAGKTFALIASIMEKRRTGQARKPVLAVPNHLVGQWAADFVKLYPGARVLAATKRDFEAENRKRLFARIATGDWDAVIVAHSSFGRIGVSSEFEQRFIQEQIDDLEQSMKELREATGEKSRNVAQLAKWRESLQSKLKKLLDAGAKDDGLTFDELGIDALYVDEAHEFKNLAFATSMTRVAGLGNPAGSQKAADLYMKVQSVLERTGGRNVVFATGTPLSNTMAEMYTLQRYLDNDALKAMGLAHFDAWARVFGEVVTDWELSPSGQYKLNSRFSKFVNMPELMQRYLAFADVITNDDIKAQLAAIGKTLPLPRVKGGKPQNIVVPRSRDQAAYIGAGETGPDGVLRFPEGSLVYRAEHLPKRAEKGADNMLKVMSDARKAALDMRLIDPSYADVPGSKVHIAADQMKRIYDRWAEKRGTQLVFIDLSTPKKARAKEAARIRELMQRADKGDDAAQQALDAMSPDEFMALDGDFSVYDDLRQKLIDRGVPANEIAFIHDANTDLRKEEMFGKVRAGTVRFLFGSTPKMGAGTNVQNRLTGLHHLDAPWRPSDLEQRDGRGIRQGNELYAEDPDGFEIEILRYATENTLDARQWQTIEGKARFIGQVRKGGLKQREIDDIAGEAANAAEMKAAASGNPLILEEMELRRRLRRLEGQATEHDREQHRIKMRLRAMRDEAGRIEAGMAAMEDDAARAAAIADADFAATVGGKTFEKPGEFGRAITDLARKAAEDGADSTPAGEFGGFALSVEPTLGESVSIIVEGAGSHDVHVADIGEADPVGVAMRVINTVRKLVDAPRQARERAGEIARQLPGLERQIGAWPDQQKLDEVSARHREVMVQLKPKQAAPAAESDGEMEAPRASIEAEPVVRLTGDELGVDFNGPQDMPALRRAAAGWYSANLRGTTATMRDGSIVRFNKRGQNKSVSGNKGDVLLRSVPAIRAIIEQGEVVFREPGNRENVVERLVIAAPVDTLGTVRRLAVSIHRTAGGDFQYDFTFDRDADAARPRIDRGGPLDEEPLPSLEVPLQRDVDTLNLFELPVEGNATGRDDGIRAELRAGMAGRLIGRLERNGRLRIGPARDFASAFTIPPGALALTDHQGTIYLLSDRIPAGRAMSLLLHEAFHSGRDGLFAGRTWGTLMDRLSQIYRQFERSGGAARTFFDAARAREQAAREAQGPMRPELRIEEFGAYAIEEYERAPGAAKRWVDDVLGAVKAWLLRTFGRQFGDVTPAELRALAIAALRDRAGEEAPTGRAAGTAAERFSIGDTAGRITEARIVEDVRGRLTDMQPHLLKAVPLNYFSELARPGMEAVDSYLKVKRSLDAYRGRKHAAADDVAQDWMKYARLGFGKDGKAKAAELAALMHDTTLAGVDPSKADAETREKPQYAQLRKRYLALSDAGKRLYGRVRDAYVQQAAELDRILLDNVRKAQEIARDRAEAEYREELARIAAVKMKPEARKKALEDADRAYKGASTKAQWAMKARLTRLRMAFEASRVEEPYFPLARFGRYFVTARDVDGTVLSFSRRERAADRDRLARDLAAAYPAARIETGVMENASDLRGAMDPRLVAEVEEIVGGSGIDPATMTNVLDQIWQRYLATMPDLSARKRFIHRKGTAGFDADALRAFSSHMFHAAHQMGRLKYGMEMQELVNQTSDQAKKADDPTRAMTLANELRHRHQWVMNPTGGKLAQTMTSTAFVWYLGATPAAALVNMSQTPMLGIPILGARFGGMAKAAAALLKASRDSVAGRGSLGRANLAADERKALEAFYETGLIDRTQSHDLAGVGETGVEYSPLRARVMAAISWMFHHAEVWNREVTALAAYRMARAAGQDWTQAVDAAHDLTWKVHFDYSNASRPRLMQNDFAKVALVFRAHNINMLYRVSRDIHQAFKGDTAQARKEARYQLAGIFGMMSLMAGVTGTLGFNLLMTIAGAAFGDDDDPFDFEQRFKASVLDILGPQLGGVVLGGVPGHYLGVDLTNRIGMPDLWFRSPSRDLQGKDEFDYWVMNSLGASVSMLGDGWRGISLLREGNYERGVEAIVPKWARDLIRAQRYAGEGLTNIRGDQVLPSDAMDAWDVIAQAIGFTPAKVTEAWERNSALNNAERRILAKRRQLLNRFALAQQAGDEAARRDALDAIRKFNAAPLHRGLAIGPDTLRQSMKARARNAAKREDGVLIQNRHLGVGLRAQLPERVY